MWFKQQTFCVVEGSTGSAPHSFSKTSEAIPGIEKHMGCDLSLQVSPLVSPLGSVSDSSARTVLKFAFSWSFYK